MMGIEVIWAIPILLGLVSIACAGMSIYHANKAIGHAGKAKELLGMAEGSEEEK